MRGSRILVVEDEPMIAIDLWDQLTNLGYDVPDPVATGDHALRAVESLRPDLILMDINIEGDLDGIATAARIPSSYRIPIIYVTGASDDSTISRAGATNPYGYIVKPFAGRELHAMIQMALARRRTEHALHAVLEERWQSRKMQALAQFAGTVADDINDLLSVIQRQLDLLMKSTTGPPGNMDPLKEAITETIENEQLTHWLWAFSGRQKLTPGNLSVATAVANTLTRFRDEAGYAGQVRTSLQDDLWTLHIDAEQFENAMLSLAINARDAMPVGGTIAVDGHNAIVARDGTGLSPEVTPGRYVLLAITDTGSGMPEHVSERVFEPFFTTKRNGGGPGLSQVFGFVRQSGGHISIKTEPGRGTTVRLWLPAAMNGATAFFTHTPLDTDPLAARPPLGDAAKAFTIRPENVRVRHGPATASDDQFPVSWHKSENALFAALRRQPEGIRHRLIVEQLPRRNAWDWTVWRPDEASAPPRHGRALSVIIAMEAAEDAVRQWG